MRVLATTNENLFGRGGEGNFREDLYYRLNVFPIAVPPLKDRGDDICFWPTHFLPGMHAGTESRKFLSKNCEKAIVSHHWPGNVRELENAVERSVILADAGKKIEAELLGIADVRNRVEANRKFHLIRRKQMKNRWSKLNGSTFKRFWNLVRGTVPMLLKSLV